jgi:hypothetical protein
MSQPVRLTGLLVQDGWLSPVTRAPIPHSAECTDMAQLLRFQRSPARVADGLQYTSREYGTGLVLHIH